MKNKILLMVSLIFAILVIYALFYSFMNQKQQQEHQELPLPIPSSHSS